ncbi:hypothetical protein SprV_0802633900 [Sparganum proliferum]
MSENIWGKDGGPTEEPNPLQLLQAAPQDRRNMRGWAFSWYPCSSDQANIAGVAAPAPGKLEVRWVNPSNPNVKILSSKAVARPKDGGSEITCDGTTEAETRCSLDSLRNFTEYEVWVEVCTEQLPVSTETHDVYTEKSEVNIASTENYIGPGEVHNQLLKEEAYGGATGGGCTNSSVKTKWTIPIAPDPANITAVAAPAAGTLEVRWVNPSKANGNLSSSRAIARPKNGGSNETCNGTAEAISATKCSLNDLRNFTEYEVWVEVCTAPAKVEVVGDVPGGGCTNISAKTKWTIPIAPDPANIKPVAAPAAGTLEVRWVNPSKANGNLSSSRAIARPKNGGSNETCNGTAEAISATKCSLNGLRNFAEYDVWVEVCTAPAKVEVDGDVPGGGCTSSALAEKWTITAAPDQAVLTAVDAPAAAHIGNFLLLLREASDICVCGPFDRCKQYFLFCVNFGSRGHLVVYLLPPSSLNSADDENDKQRVHIVYELYPEPQLDRFKIPPPIRFEDFDAHIKKLQSDADLLQEFRTLDELTKQQDGDYGLTAEMAALVPELNRYADMTPYDQNIVRLDRNWSTYCGDQQPMGPLINEMRAVYVNANYVKACQYSVMGQAEVAPKSSLPKYIATQGPLSHTAADFLYMVHQQRVPVVVMLCNIEEGGKRKCAQYWPDTERLPEKKSSLTRTVTVTLQHAVSSPSMVIRTITVQPEGESESWTFTQLHFLAWADHAVPDLDEFYDLLQTYSRLRSQKPFSEAFGPTIVHCSDGVGRTGTLVCADILLDQLRKHPARIDVFGTVLASRVFRRCFVQVKEQLRFLYEFLAYCIAKEGHAANAAALRPVPELTPNAPAEYMNLPVDNEYMNVRGSAYALPPVTTVKAPPPPSAPPVVTRLANSVALNGIPYRPQRPLPNASSLAKPSTLVAQGGRPLLPPRPLSYGTTPLQVPVNVQNERTSLPGPPLPPGPYEF